MFFNDFIEFNNKTVNKWGVKKKKHDKNHIFFIDLKIIYVFFKYILKMKIIVLDFYS